MTKKPTIHKNTTDKSKDTESTTPSLKIILTSKCKTLSNKSTLTYNIATGDNDLVFIRVQSNTGGGYFSNEWILIDDINNTLKGITNDQPISSIHLFPLFKGRSINSPGYLLASLINERVMIPHQEIKRQYAFSGMSKLMEKINNLKENTKK